MQIWFVVPAFWYLVNSAKFWEKMHKEKSHNKIPKFKVVDISISCLSFLSQIFSLL